MKRVLLILVLMLTVLSIKAMSYDEARERAWFLTDKMAYELNLTAEQYERAYQINLDYFMNVRSASDCTGIYWQYRDCDLRCVLFDWQYNLYCEYDYFYRPVRWYEARWYYPVFDHYRYGYFYFNRPNVYVSYSGGMWLRRGRHTPSPYQTMRPRHGVGMRDLYNRGGLVVGTEHPNNNFRQNRPGGQFKENYFQGNRPNKWRNKSENYSHPRFDNQRQNGDVNKRHETEKSNKEGNNRSQLDNKLYRNDNNNRTMRRGFVDGYTNYRQTGKSHSQSQRSTFVPIMNKVNKGGSNPRSERTLGGR